MRFKLDIKSSKAAFVIKHLKGLFFEKTKPIGLYKTNVLEDVKAAVEEIRRIKTGKLVARDAEELINEL